MEPIEKEFDLAWDEVDRQREAHLKRGTDQLSQHVEQELNQLLSAVRHSLTEDQPELEREVEKIRQMSQQFRDGVEMWQRKAHSGIKMIEEKQRGLGLLVQEASIRTAARREDLIERQRQRSDETRDMCMDLLRENAMSGAAL